MSTDQCQQIRTHLGMHALGRLEPAATVALQAHLDGCPDCRSELRELRGVARVLRQADPERVDDQPAGPPQALRTAVFTAVDQERRRNRSVRTAQLAAAAAVLIIALGGVFVVTTQQSTNSQPVAFTTQPAGVHAAASVENRNWGTSIALDVTGLPQGQRYAVWLERPDGSRMPAGSFVAGGEKKMSMQLAVGLPMSDAAALGISTPTDQSPLLRAPLHP
ncbi:anti-sigma factor [Rhodococcus opacus]|uniref:anti-sigma factor n=1 Tax=Rhodococcus opacus TaxID=37919 RepID=UPI00294A43F7|nr:anti-sigma factor [Rhodococcus opacus]MDV6244852.1 anti-sigma factor [Rhodococcus opacus]